MAAVTLPVLDKGYLRLIDTMGTDLDIVNDAKASFAKESSELGNREDRLLRFLYRRKEFAPFRHGVLKFEWYAPYMVTAQIKKYAIACSQVEDQRAWSEASRRYITIETEFYAPDVWRSAPENKKQGSGEPLDAAVSEDLWHHLYEYQYDGQSRYEWALSLGAAPEQARLFLPAYGLYTSWRMTASLNAVLFMLLERLPYDAQWETRQYAIALRSLTRDAFPVTMSAFDQYSGIEES